MFSSNSSQVSSAIQYIEDVFSCFLYTGDATTRTITNNLDLSTYGGLVWIKDRSGIANNFLFDTTRGVLKELNSNTGDAQASLAASLTAFNTTGFNLGTAAEINDAGPRYVSWSFKEQPKFFDIVSYTGTGANRNISHNLGSVPGMMIIKRTDSAESWPVYHRSYGNTGGSRLDTTVEFFVLSTFWNNTTPTSSVFTVGTSGEVNQSGGTYIAYLFAHDAGGFGLAGTDNVISCGSVSVTYPTYTTVNLGYEPQFVMFKLSSAAGGDWLINDNMRGMPAQPTVATYLAANLDGFEVAGGGPCFTTSTGFIVNNDVATGTYIYMAIRRGPMKIPTTGTSVFGMSARSGTGANATVTGGQLDDVVLVKNRGAAVASLMASRLTSVNYLVTSTTAAQVSAASTILQANPWDVMDGVKVGTSSTITNASANTFINYLFKRAPSFMDVVCYTGTGANLTLSHNLAAVPQLMIVKQRNAVRRWAVYNFFNTATDYMSLNETAASASSTSYWNDTTPTSSVFYLGNAAETNAGATSTYIAYLFATLAGVSKVGSYTGTGATQTVACGFTAGARFILIKATSTTGNWYVWDTARGIIAGNDPYWLTNSTAAEITTTDWVDTAVTGFELSNTVGNLANSSGVSYIFLAIA
jgi:hypothetical protein